MEKCKLCPATYSTQEEVAYHQTAVHDQLAYNEETHSRADELRVLVDQHRVTISGLTAQLAASKEEVAILKKGLVGDYDLDAWLDWAKEAVRLKGTNESLTKQLATSREDVGRLKRELELLRAVATLVDLRTDNAGRGPADPDKGG